MFDKDYTDDELARLRGVNVVDQDGDKIGSADQIYLDDQTSRPTWVTVNTGFFGTKETFIPLQGASMSNDEIRVPYTKAFVKDAPNMDADGHITEAEEAELFRYYSMEDRYASTAGRGYDADNGADRGADLQAGYDADNGADRGADLEAGRAGLVGDRDVHHEGDSMVRHEEELRVGKERVETGRLRLRKYVVTENKTVTVPVEREEYRLEREPLRDGDVDNGRIGEDEIVVTETAERPVVQKDVVAKERVGLAKETVQDQVQVNEQVRSEQVEVDRDGGRDVRDRGVAGDRDYVEGRDDRSLLEKGKDALDRDNDGHIG